jgi:predicted RNA methylase
LLLRPSRWLFHQICFRKAEPPRYGDQRFRERYSYDVESNKRFFARLVDVLDVAGKTVLDVGCGCCATCIEVARRGATRVVGVDLTILPSGAHARRAGARAG